MIGFKLTKEKLKTIGKWAGCAALAAWLCAITVQTCHSPHAAPQGFQAGGGNVLTGGAGISKVTTNSPGLLAGSGTVSNPLTSTLSVTGVISGTGSSGSPLASSGDIAGVTAGSGLINGGTTGTVTLDVGAGSGLTVSADLVAVNAGSGLTADGTNVRVNNGNGLNFSSGALQINAGSGITADGTNARANLGAQMTFSAGAIQPNLTGGTCSNGQAYTSLSSVGAGTCGNVGRNGYGGTHFEWIDEWTGLHDSLTTGTFTEGPVWQFKGLTGAGFTDVTGVTGRPGILEITNGASATGVAAVTTSSNAVNFGDGNWDFEWVGGFPTLSASGQEYTAKIGFWDVYNTANQTDGCYFLYDRGAVSTAPGTGTITGNVDKWQCWCASNATRTGYTIDGQTTGAGDGSFVTINSPIAALVYPNTNIYHMKITMTTSTQADFYSCTGTSCTKICQIKTNIPTGSARLEGAGWAIVKSSGTNTLAIDTDWTDLQVDLTGARSP